MARTPVTFSVKDFFHSYVKRTGNKAALTSRQHKLILDNAGEVMKDVLLQEGQLKLFGRLGFMMIRRVKPKGDKKAPIDFSASKQIDGNAYHFNDHSDGYIARVMWDRKKCVLQDKHMWLFKPVRAFKRGLAGIMKAGSVEYPVLTKVL